MVAFFGLMLFYILILIIGLWWSGRDERAESRLRGIIHHHWKPSDRKQFSPVLAYYYGSEPRESYTGVQRIGGALGIRDQAVFFVAQDGIEKLTIPFAAIHHVNPTWIRSKSNTFDDPSALFIHYTVQRNARTVWRKAAFALDDPDRLHQRLKRLAGLPMELYGLGDYGPIDATRMTQDVYGQWHTDRAGSLYLAPNRLLFDFVDPISITQIRSAEVYASGGRWRKLNPFSEDLLRIEYDDADRQHQVIGFLSPRAEDIGAALHRKMRAPFEVVEGRKKKEQIK